MWVPLRFPGQYYDEETDLVENWHRYYYPSIGRYLQPEPLLTANPRTWLDAERGILDAYSYAWKNPITFIDEDGLFSKKGQCKNSPEEKACKDAANATNDPELKRCVIRQCDKAFNCTEKEKKRECEKKTYRRGGEFFEGQAAAAANGGSLGKLGKEVVCSGLDLSPKCRAQTIVHELAHTCGWDHNGGKGVPQQNGEVDCK